MILAHELLFGWLTSDSRRWYSKREFPEGKRERVARKALANAVLKRDEHVLRWLAVMIDPPPDDSIVGQILQRKIKFVPVRDLRRERKTLDRHDADIAGFMHDWLAKHRGEPLEEAVAAAVEEFQITERPIWDAWKKYKPMLPSKEWIFRPRD
jgi:hypothetical protein